VACRYTLRLIVEQAGHETTREAEFTLVE